MTKKIFALVMVISVLGCFLAGCSGGSDSGSSTPPAGSTAGTPPATPPAGATAGTPPAAGATAGGAAPGDASAK